MMFGAFPIVYRINRGWNEGVAGLPFIGIAIGMIFALAFSFTYDHKRYLRCIKNSPTGFAAPEDRLPPLIIGGIALPIGLFWFAWTNHPHLPWAASACATIPFGFGMVLIFLGVMSYLIDAYTIFAASVLAGSGIIRSLFGAGKKLHSPSTRILTNNPAAFPLFTVQMYQKLGIHWASTIPAFLALACVFFPFFLYKYGASIRAKCKYAAQSEAFMQKMRAGAARAAPPTADSETSSHTAPVHAEEEAEAYEMEPRFEEMKAGQETENTLKRGASNRTHRSRRSVNSLQHYDNPYEIDRVNTRESFKAGGSLRML